MTEPDSFRTVAERASKDWRVQLMEDRHGGYHLRKISSDTGEVLFTAPIHGDRATLAEAREYFPDLVPFGGAPVDAT